MVTVHVENVPLEMEVDTGSPVSIIPEEVYKQKFRHVPLVKSDAKFCSFTGEETRCIGQIRVNAVSGRGMSKSLWLYVLPEAKFVLLGRDWLSGLNPVDWHSVKKSRVSGALTMDTVIKKHSHIFQGLGKLKGRQAHIRLKPNIQPKLTHPNREPHAINEKWKLNWTG